MNSLVLKNWLFHTMKTSTLTHDAELKQKEQERGTKIICVILTILCGAGAIGSSLMIGPMEHIFIEIYPPGTRFPLLTEFAIHGKLALPIFAILLTLAGLVGSFIPRRTYSTLWVLGCNAALILLSIIIWIGIGLPSLVTITSVSGSGPS